MTLRNILLAGTALGAAALLAGPAMAGSAAATQNDITRSDSSPLRSAAAISADGFFPCAHTRTRAHAYAHEYLRRKLADPGQRKRKKPPAQIDPPRAKKLLYIPKAMPHTQTVKAIPR